ncbi:MAG TPA: hypothetical protein VFZ49_06885 [Pyrinomonadaceae bacterium]
MGKVLIGLVIGLLIGGVATFYFFVGVPRAEQAPGTPIQKPDPSGPSAGTAQIVLRQALFNEVLSTIFHDMSDPTFALTGGSVPPPSADGCASAITILEQGSGAQTGVNFQNNRLEAPIAFSGAYNSAFGCFRFNGWANSVMELRFDQSTQSVFGQLNVETVNLDNVNPLINSIVTPVVQSTLNARVNPIKIVDGQQIAVNLPIESANGTLVANVTDVRAEVTENALNLFVQYDVTGGQSGQSEQPPQ